MNHQAKTALYFFKNGKFISVLRDGQHRAVFGSADTALAEQLTSKASVAGLLATDTKGSPLLMQDRNALDNLAFSAYGHGPDSIGSGKLLGFNGELIDPATRLYLLGTAYHRPFSTSLMRFISSDNQSPFGIGGINAYAYCEGDPINRSDPSGHGWLKKKFNFYRTPENSKLLDRRRPRVSGEVEQSANMSVLDYPRAEIYIREKNTLREFAKVRSSDLARKVYTSNAKKKYTPKETQYTLEEINAITQQLENYRPKMFETLTLLSELKAKGLITDKKYTKGIRIYTSRINTTDARLGVMDSYLDEVNEIRLSKSTTP